MAELAGEAGIPEGVFNVVPTSRPADVGGVMTSSETVRKISFTGSTEIGRLLLGQAAGTIKKVSMELGGNAPFIVFDDADLDAAADGLLASKFRNAGQTCVCANRVFVQSKIMDTFAAKVHDRVARLKVASGEVDGAEIGPLINEDAVRKVERLVSAARTAGARLVTGGVTASMDIAREEIFGPVAAMIAFDHEDEVVAMANDTPYGLAAYAYTRDLGRAWRVSEALEYGMVGINEGVISSAAAPFGGVKQSGVGREGSRYGIDDYLELKYIMMGGLGA